MTIKAKENKPKKKSEGIKTATLATKQKSILSRLDKLEKAVNNMSQSIGNEFNVLANRMDRIDGLSDRHSTQLRGLEAFARQTNPAIAELKRDIAKVNEDMELIEELENEESE